MNILKVKTRQRKQKKEKKITKIDTNTTMEV